MYEHVSEETGEAVKVQLEQFELASLVNLLPEDVEEAVTLLPSLNRFKDDEVLEMLDILKKKIPRA